MSTTPANFVPMAALTLEGGPRPSLPPAFHVMVKPSGPICNIDCTYCFYLRKEQLYDEDTRFRMTEEVLDSFTRQYIQGQRVPEVTFGWQGGEPTLMGLDFFRLAVEKQRQYAPRGMRVLNAFQTNGILLNDEWARFFKDNGFLVGLSLDGPEDLHDAHRVDKAGNSTFQRVHRALKLLQRHGVEHNILCVVNRLNAEHPSRVYRFFRAEGVEFIQFIPVVEPLPDGGVTEWTVTGEQWGRFLCGVFDEWVRRDVGRIFVQSFDAALQAWVGMEPAICVHAKTCGNCLAIEHNGDLFACDHYVTPEYFLGNVTQTELTSLVASPYQRRFGRDKRDRLPRQCRECDVLFACNGGCPKDRFAVTKDGEPGLHHLCAGYYRFFTHVAPYMEKMASLVRRGYPAAAIMDTLPAVKAPVRTVGKNDACPCGSGKKFKHCCERRR